ncbi:hypothetical protein [Burkholderia pseudomallei]|uniref:hypothetical protein n=1 Tax=Burkholderia pseudomallei TaxID=28450 RepID=UPI000976E223|nr:hypothetical protein [Burkholderia pseudomallei]
MNHTTFSHLDGPSWERMCRAAFVLKYGDRYQHMPASPGDYGIEGWTADGHAFQCYCPEKNYTQSELHDAVRDKITTDIPKLRRYEKEIKARIGDTRIHSWLFVTPVIPHNDIHKHARKKEAEAREWACSILDSNFSIFIQDAEHYATQFEESRRSQGAKLELGPRLPPTVVLPEAPEAFQLLVDRKNRVRLQSKANRPDFERSLKALNDTTERKFVECDIRLSAIERVSPQAYKQIVHVIGRYAEEMTELQFIWSDEPQKLIDRIKAELSERLSNEPKTTISVADAQHLADLMVSRWLAVCQLDFSESE